MAHAYSKLLRRTRSNPSYVILPILLAWVLLHKRKAAKRAKREKSAPNSYPTTPQLEIAQRDVYRRRSDGLRELLVLSNARVSTVLVEPIKQSTYSANREAFRSRPNSGKATKVAVNTEFFKQLRAIFRIIIPSWRCKETFLIILHSSFLMLRTYLSYLVAQLDGRLVGDIVSANGPSFLRGLGLWFALAVPSVYTNAMIQYLQRKLSLSFRTKLTRYVHDLYLSKQHNYYKLINLDVRIDGADQYITTDIAKFCDTLSSLYSNISKPTLDLILFNIQLGRSIGRYGTLGLVLSYVATGWVLRKVTPAFGKLAAVEAALEGDFRAAHARLIINSEEIAFYNGAQREKTILDTAYDRLMRHINSIFKIRIAYTMTEDMVVKYLWSACGYCIISIPVFFRESIEKAKSTRKPGDEESGKDVTHIASRTKAYISNRRLLLSLAEAGGRLMYSWKDLTALAGYTFRVFSLLSTLHDVNEDEFPSNLPSKGFEKNERFYDLGNIQGRMIKDSPESSLKVELLNVPIVAPGPGNDHGGEELVRDLAVRMMPGDHLIVSGPNGSGKTSIARVLAGLWPAFSGIVTRPEDDDIMFLPQRPYLSHGSLRDQIIYPHSYPEFVASGRTDETLLEILEHVHLSYIPGREGGLDTRKEWKDVFSGGEKQRMGMARLFYHCPKFGVLDECTSAVSTDVEGLMYQHAKNLGITLITISHRPSLFKYHFYLLKLVGNEGKWETSQIGTAAENLSFQREIEEIKAKLDEAPKWKSRLDEIEKELNFS